MSKFERTYDTEWEKLARTLGRDPSAEEAERLEGELFERWIAEKRFDDLIRHVQEQYDLEGGRIDIIVLGKGLRDAGEIERVHALFRGLVGSRSRAFWRSWPEAQKGHLGHMRDAAKYYATCMEVYAEYWHNLWSLKLEAEQDALKQEMLAFQARMPPAAPARKSRGMTETQFWALIGKARAGAGSATQFAGAVEEQLKACAPKDIEAFDKLLTARLVKLNTWDLWAFAHLARGGCSDDSFDYFRAWVVAQGRVTFDAAVAGPVELLEHHEDCWDFQCEELLSVAGEAYRAATGEDLVRPARKAAGTSGMRWQESELEARYPEVYRRFVRG